MQCMITKKSLFVLVAAMGLMGARTSLAIQPSNVLDVIEKTRAALEETAINLGFVQEQIEQEEAIIGSLEEAFRAGENPEVIALEVEALVESIGKIEETISDIAAELGSKSVTPSTGAANLHSINESGVKATIDFVDNSTTLVVNGTATGLDPNESYVTLIYDNGSVPGGPGACAPTIFDPEDSDFLLRTMLLGFWNVDPSGNGTLSAINANFGADYVPLDKFRATSVRLVLGPPPSPGAPPLTKLMACGRVATRPGK